MTILTEKDVFAPSKSEQFLFCTAIYPRENTKSFYSRWNWNVHM